MSAPRPGAALTPVTELRLHPLADRVPEMRAAEWGAFIADVAERGVLAQAAAQGALADAG